MKANKKNNPQKIRSLMPQETCAMYHYHNEYSALGIGAIEYYKGLSPRDKRFIDDMTKAIIKAANIPPPTMIGGLKMDGSQIKFANLDDFMRETHAELKIGLCKLYFDDGEWVVVKAKSVDSKYIVQDRFLDAVPSALESALRFFYTLAA